MTDVEDPNPPASSCHDAARSAVATAVWTLVWLALLGRGDGRPGAHRHPDVRHDAVIRVLVVHGVTPFLYFGVWPVVVLALWRRKWVLASVAVALVGVQMAVTLPAVWPHSTPSWAAAAPHVKVLVGNVKADNSSQPEAARRLLTQGADVVVLVEVDDGVGAHARRCRLRRHLPLPGPATRLLLGPRRTPSTRSSRPRPGRSSISGAGGGPRRRR